jgi:phosphoglycerate dehydrogenase-like enzyme
MHKAILLAQDPATAERVFAGDRRSRIDAILPLRPGVVRREDLAALASELRDVEVAFSTWSMPALTAADLVHLPRLRAVLYAAGTVKGFARPLLERGIQVSSAWQANALPVAETTLAHILLALKQTFQQARAIRTARAYATARPPVTGTYGATVGIISLGAIGRRVIELLAPFDLRVLAYDPFAQPQSGIELAPLDEVFRRADVVSLHAPWIPATEGMIRGEHLRLMRPHATFINTARGALVREDELAAALRDRPDLQAVLDVTWPEPPPADSPLYDLPNVLLTPHIAGSAGNEVLRMADWMIDECGRLVAGEALRHAVAIDMLDRMA